MVVGNTITGRDIKGQAKVVIQQVATPTEGRADSIGSPDRSPRRSGGVHRLQLH